MVAVQRSASDAAIFCPDGARLIPLTRGQFAIVDADMYDNLAQWSWYAAPRRGDASAYGYYAARNTRVGETADGKRRTVFMHQAVRPAQDGCEPDHVNGDGLNNRLDNLRLVSHADNVFNRRLQANNTSGYSGIYRSRGGWLVQIKTYSKRVYIGRFQRLEDAVRSRDAAMAQRTAALPTNSQRSVAYGR